MSSRNRLVAPLQLCERLRSAAQRILPCQKFRFSASSGQKSYGVCFSSRCWCSVFHISYVHSSVSEICRHFNSIEGAFSTGSEYLPQMRLRWIFLFIMQRHKRWFARNYTSLFIIIVFILLLQPPSAGDPRFPAWWSHSTRSTCPRGRARQISSVNRFLWPSRKVSF